jgi:hypothetical protein
MSARRDPEFAADFYTEGLTAPFCPPYFTNRLFNQ